MPNPAEPKDSEISADKQLRKREAKLRRARVRNFIFTLGPNKLSGGRIRSRHLAQDVVVREVEFHSPGWPAQFDGLRIGHISDIHLGELMPIDRALAVVDLLAEQEPDLVACTGDVIDLHIDGEVAKLLRAMKEIGAPLGTALVLGNHDELHCGETLAGMAIELGLNVLQNEALSISHRGDNLLVAGTRWAKSIPQNSRFVDLACGQQAHVLLAHNPKAFRRAAQLEIPLTLSGHTHGGQVAMKSSPNRNLAMTQHSAGPFTRGASRLYVTTGVGAWFPLRVNCPAEIAMITMRHGEEH